MSIAISGKFHPPQPEKKLKADANVGPIPAMINQKSKKLGKKEWDLTSFESEPAEKSTTNQRKGGLVEKAPEPKMTKKEVKQSR